MPRFRHAIRRASATVASAVFLAALGAGSAHADTSPPSLYGGYASYTLAPGSAGKAVSYYVQGAAATTSTVSGLVVAYDVSGLAGVAALSPNTGKCTTSGTLITCHEGSLAISSFVGQSAQGYIGSKNLPITLAPVAGAAAGASGTVAVSVSGTGLAASSASTISVSLADGPDLVVAGSANGNLSTASVNPGSTYRHGLRFTNDGDQPAQGVTVEIESYGHGVDVPETHKNCQYAAPTTAYCYIPDVIAPGASETLSPSIRVLTSTDLMWQGLSVRVVPGYAGLSTYTVGAGTAFTLKDSKGAAQVTATGHAGQNNIDGGDNTLSLKLAVTSASADVTGSINFYPWQVAGQYLGSVYVTNAGTGFIELGRSANWELSGDFKVPAGVDVVSVPDDWSPVVNGVGDANLTGKPGYSEYWFNAGIEMSAGGQGGSSTGNLIIQPQAGFTGGAATLTVGINQQAAALYTIFGNVDSDPANDTVSYDIPAAS